MNANLLIRALQEQRNSALDNQAALAADLAEARERIAELEAGMKPTPEPPPAPVEEQPPPAA